MRERPHWLVQETQHVGYVRAAIKHIADNDNVAFAKRALHFAINDSIHPHQPQHGVELAMCVAQCDQLLGGEFHGHGKRGCFVADVDRYWKPTLGIEHSAVCLGNCLANSFPFAYPGDIKARFAVLVVGIWAVINRECSGIAYTGFALLYGSRFDTRLRKRGADQKEHAASDNVSRYSCWHGNSHVGGCVMNYLRRGELATCALSILAEQGDFTPNIFRRTNSFHQGRRHVKRHLTAFTDIKAAKKPANTRLCAKNRRKDGRDADAV